MHRNRERIAQIVFEVIEDTLGESRDCPRRKWENADQFQRIFSYKVADRIGKELPVPSLLDRVRRRVVG